ncbi:CZB domain-containing protein [Thiobacillus sp. SCN 63-57]|uniref:CZB domain-containing protein n=1 Tax=Thiobacillus sp. SCN 63-57 TaxID=1660145 RepID=UPI000ABB42F3|nr:CZB domain-containing protein [Thiobacillus sp. SCN 63-57]
MNWMEIIGAHVMWKQRLTAFLAGNSTESLDPDTIRLDDRCALGQWIYGAGKAMSELPRYEEVRGLHAQFHQYAAEVVNLHLSGNTVEAEKLLQGDYSRLSEKLKHRLIGLSSQVKAASEGIPRF